MTLSFEEQGTRAAARMMIAEEVRSGRMTRQPCERCGDARVEGHHDDYSKPLDVRWLCQKHHREVHRELGTPMGRPPRAGTAAGKITIRATDAELAAWDAAARHAGADRSTWLRQAALELAETGRERKRGWMRAGVGRQK